MGIAALVLGIVSIILACIPCMWAYASIVAVVALVLGLLGIKAAKKHNGQGRGPAIGGVVCSVVAVVLSLIFWFACTKAVEAIDEGAKAMGEAMDDWDKGMREEADKIDQELD